MQPTHPRRLAAVLALALAACPCVAQPAANADGSFPKPALASPQWTLDLEVATPRPVAIQTAAGTQWYWYLSYKIVNNTGEDRLFLPEITVVTDAGHIIDANVNVPPAVFETIKSTLRNPLLESPDTIVGNLKQSVDFAKESVAIWPAFKGDVDRFTVFFTGISGETAPLLSPSTGQPLTEAVLDPYTGKPALNDDGSPQTRLLLARRTTQLDYATPGTTDNPQNTPVLLQDRKDVMR